MNLYPGNLSTAGSVIDRLPPQDGITAGPWELSGSAIWGVSPWNARVRLADVVIHPAINGINWQANAAALRAAPELLLAGKHLAVKLAETYRAAGIDPSGCQAIRDFLAVAAKAEGRS